MYFCLYSLYYVLLRDCSLQIMLMDAVKIPEDHQFAPFKVTLITSLQSSLFLILKLTLNFFSDVSLSWCHVIGRLDVCVIEEFNILHHIVTSGCRLHVSLTHCIVLHFTVIVYLRLKHCVVFLPSCLLQGSKASQSRELRTSVLKLWRVVCQGNGMWLHLAPGRWKY